MNTTIETNFDGLKRMSKEFIDALPTLNSEGLENGFKAFGLAYLGCEFTNDDLGKINRDSAAPALFRVISDLYLKRMAEIELGHQPNMKKEQTHYAVHLHHCNIGEYEGSCKYGDDNCPALEHASLKEKLKSSENHNTSTLNNPPTIPAAYEIKFGNSATSSVELTPSLERAKEALALGYDVRTLFYGEHLQTFQPLKKDS
jgi:hypothetical protein